MVSPVVQKYWNKGIGQWRATELFKGLEHKIFKEKEGKTKGLGFINMEKRKWKEAGFKLSGAKCRKGRARIFSEVDHKDITAM